MTAAEEHTHDGAGTAAPVLGPGAQLRAAREAAGMSLDDVAQQLKLAPRQVKALEEEDFGALPGRTFSRGFVRNYARLLNLDAQDLLTHLPDGAHAPALESPTLHSTGSLMAELPNASTSRPGLGRWLIPLVLIACIVAAAGYEWYRGGLTPLTEPAHQATADAPDRKAAVTAPAGTSAVTTPGQATPLPNPLGVAADSTPAASSPASPSASDAAPNAQQPEVQAQPVTPENAPVVLTYRGPSWTEIRDASGQLMLAKLIPANSIQPVGGTAPFDLVIGNASAVTLKYRGQPIDLLPFTRANVARLILK